MAIIMIDNYVRTGTASSIGTVSGSIAGLVDGRTGTSESFATGATREFVIDGAIALTVNCLGIARHNLNTAGATITIQGSTDNVSYSTLFSQTPPDNRCVMYFTSNYSYRYYKVQISGHSEAVFATDIALGGAIALDRDQKAGFISPFMADSDIVTPNITRGQNLAGLSVESKLKRVRMRMNYYSSSNAFVSNITLIKDALKKYPVYIKWKESNDSEAFYCWPYRGMPNLKYSANIPGYEYFDGILDLEGITE